MAVEDPLTQYDCITSDELFDSFMDVAISAEKEIDITNNSSKEDESFSSNEIKLLVEKNVIPSEIEPVYAISTKSSNNNNKPNPTINNTLKSQNEVIVDPSFAPYLRSSVSEPIYPEPDYDDTSQNVNKIKSSKSAEQIFDSYVVDKNKVGVNETNYSVAATNSSKKDDIYSVPTTLSNVSLTASNNIEISNYSVPATSSLTTVASYTTAETSKNNDTATYSVPAVTQQLVTSDLYAVPHKDKSKPSENSTKSNYIEVITTSSGINLNNQESNMNNDVAIQTNYSTVVIKGNDVNAVITSPSYEINNEVKNKTALDQNLYSSATSENLYSVATSNQEENMYSTATSNNENLYSTANNTQNKNNINPYSMANLQNENLNPYSMANVKTKNESYKPEEIAYSGLTRNKTHSKEFLNNALQTIEQGSSNKVKSAGGTNTQRRFHFGFGKSKSTDDDVKSSRHQSWSALTETEYIEKQNKKSGTYPRQTNVQVLCSGYMFKQGGTGFTPKNWRLRWFELKEDNCLYYYKSEQDNMPNGAVMLLKYDVAGAAEVNKRYAFKLIKGGARTYYFATNSEEEKKRWMKYLNDATKVARSDQTSIPECSLKNVSIPALSITEPDCHGNLLKQGNSHKSWHKRYCVLKFGCLFYYESMSDTVAIGVFKLHDYTFNASNNIKNGIEALPPVRKMRTYYFAADTDTELRRWINSFRFSVSKFK